MDRIKLDDYKFKYSYEDVGFITVEETLDVINIIDVFVSERRRKEGIASKILSVVINDYKDRTVRFMLEVREGNVPAIKLYEKFGFKVIHIRYKYYKTENALIMERVSDNKWKMFIF